jgi:hypothetical protein
MKVKHLIEQLQRYEPDTDLLVAYWDKDCIEGYISGWGEADRLLLTNEQFEEVCDRYEDGEWHFQSSAADDFADIAREVLAEAETPNE